MKRKATIGITRDLFDEDGKLIIPGPGLKLIENMPNVEYKIFKDIEPEITPEQLQSCDIVLTLQSKFTPSSLKGINQLISIHCNAAGFDPIDLNALTKSNVILCNTPKAVRRPMAVAIITFILTLSLKLQAKIELARAGLWDERSEHLGVSLVGKTLGSVGVGGIGHELFRLIKPFGMKHIAYDPYIKKESIADVDVNLVDFDTLLAESDFLAINCPLNKETYHIIGESELRKMKKEAFLINTSRGPTVDEAALIKALRKKWIMGAGIDVFEQEPTPTDNPLLNMNNVIATPHALGWEDSVWRNKWDENISQISRVINGEIPDGLVNREVWDNPRFRDKLRIFQESIR